MVLLPGQCAHFLEAPGGIRLHSGSVSNLSGCFPQLMVPPSISEASRSERVLPTHRTDLFGCPSLTFVWSLTPVITPGPRIVWDTVHFGVTGPAPWIPHSWVPGIRTWTRGAFICSPGGGLEAQPLVGHGAWALELLNTSCN